MILFLYSSPQLHAVSDKSSVFGRFLGAEWSDWADSFCIETGIIRYKFRVPTTWFSEKLKKKFLKDLPFKKYRFTHSGVNGRDFELSHCITHIKRQLYSQVVRSKSNFMIWWPGLAIIKENPDGGRDGQQWLKSWFGPKNMVPILTAFLMSPFQSIRCLDRHSI
jgi:hypothetical protein